MNRPLFNPTRSLRVQQVRALAANYRLIGRPGNMGSLPMPRLTPGSNLAWQPSLLDTLRAPVTRLRD